MRARTSECLLKLRLYPPVGASCRGFQGARGARSARRNSGRRGLGQAGTPSSRYDGPGSSAFPIHLWSNRMQGSSSAPEAVLHRVDRADVVIFLEFDSELMAPRLRAAEEALALLARARASRLEISPELGRRPGCAARRADPYARAPGHSFCAARRSVSARARRSRSGPSWDCRL